MTFQKGQSGSPDAVFRKGISGNPAGRTKGLSGTLNAARKLIAPHLEQLTEQTLAAALKGDTNAAVACLEIAATAEKARAA